MAERIGFISTRFAGSDGVSLESAKWAEVLRGYHHDIFWYAGRLDRPSEESMCVPEAFFAHPENEWISRRIWGGNVRERLVTQRIRDMAEYLKETLYEFVDRFDVTLLVVENALSIPMHLPLGAALTEFLAETRLPAIGHHHDFYWERSRYALNAVHDLLDACFPPRDPNLRHVVINQAALEELSWRRGVPSMLIPNVLDFEKPPRRLPRSATRELRHRLGLQPDRFMILQPTRVVPRKGIEHAIQLVEMLGEDKYVLVISHEAGDEGLEYRHALSQAASDAGVNLRFIVAEPGGIAAKDPVSAFRSSRHREEVRKRWDEGRFTLGEIYQCADLVTYPSLYEGFGNAFLEAVYYGVPLVVNRYATFTRDIEPKGFRVIVMEGFVSRHVVEEVRKVLADPGRRKEMARHNYERARRFYSYAVLRRSLRTLIMGIRGYEMA